MKQCCLNINIHVNLLPALPCSPAPAHITPWHPGRRRFTKHSARPCWLDSILVGLLLAGWKKANWSAVLFVHGKFLEYPLYEMHIKYLLWVPESHLALIDTGGLNSCLSSGYKSDTAVCDIGIFFVLNIAASCEPKVLAPHFLSSERQSICLKQY